MEYVKLNEGRYDFQYLVLNLARKVQKQKGYFTRHDVMVHWPENKSRRAYSTIATTIDRFVTIGFAERLPGCEGTSRHKYRLYPDAGKVWLIRLKHILRLLEECVEANQ